MPSATNKFGVSIYETQAKPSTAGQWINGAAKNRFCSVILVLFLGLLTPFLGGGQTTVTFTSSDSWTVPAGVTSVTVQAWGGGGGGGGSISNNNGAGGGGGGAFTTNSSLSVIPGTVYTIVIGTGGASGTTGAGAATNGGTGSATIFGSNLVIANGGVGGFGSNNGAAGGTGGVGGTFNGGNGAAGGGTGGGGGGGAGSTGLGKNALGGTAGAATTNNGGAGGNGSATVASPGNDYGGGGSGGRQTSSNAKQGGVGASGLLIISYTCPTYSLLSTSATNICVNNTAIVNLASNAANLPVGTYTVTYDLSGANTATGTTAAMTVSIPGVGSFVTASLANSGATSVTVTNLYSGLPSLGCGNAISANNAVSVTVYPAFISGTITNTGETICYNTTPTITIGSNTLASGGDGIITYQWQSSSDAGFTSPVNIISSNTPTYTPTAPLTSDTWYRRQAKDGTCNTTFTSSANTWKVTVLPNFTPGAIANTGQTICYNTVPATIGSNTAASGGDGTITYQWQSSLDDLFTTPVNILVNTATYTPTAALTADTWYRRQAKDGTCNTTFTSSTNTWKVTVRPNFTAGDIANTGETICYNTTPTITIGSTTLASGGDGTITYQWQSSSDNLFTTPINISVNTATYTPTAALTADTWYRRQSKDGTCNTTFTSSTNIWKVTVRPNFTAGDIAITGETICYNTTPTITIGSNIAASGGDGAITYQWQSSSDNLFTTPVNISVNTATYTPTAALTADTWYRRQSKDGTCNATFTSSTNTWKVTVRPNFTAGAISTTGETICYNTIPSTIGSTTLASGGDGTISYQWQSSSDAGFTSPVNISSNTATYTPTAALTSNTWYRRQAKDGTCNTTFASSANIWKVTVNASVTSGSLSAVPAICIGTAPNEILSAIDGSGDGTISYEWQTNASGSFENIVGANVASYQPPVLSTTTSYQRRTVSVSGGTTCYSGYTSPITVTVNPLPQGSLTANGPFCATGTGVLTFTASAGTGLFTIVYNDGIANRTANGVVSGTPFSTFTTPVISTTTYTLLSVTDVNGCVRTTGFTGSTATITVNPIPTITATPTTQTVCNSGTINPIVFSGNVGSATYTWNRDNPAGLTFSGLISGTNGTGDISGIITNSTNAPITVTITSATPAANGCTGVTVNNIATITVNPTATVNAISSQTVCHGSPTAAVNFSGNATSYTWTNTNPVIGLAGSGTGNIASFTASNPGTSPITSTVTVTPVYTNGGASCNGTAQSFTITVNPIPVFTSTLTPPDVCSGSNFSYAPNTDASGVTPTFNWSRSVVAGISNAAASGTGNINEVLLNTTNAPVSVTYVYTVAATNNSVSCANPVNYNIVVSVKPTPTVAASPNAAQSICQGVANNLSPITLTNPNGLGATLSWTRDNTGTITGIAANGSTNPITGTLSNATGVIQTTIFTGTATYNGCSSSTTVSVQVNPPIVNNVLSNPVEQTICAIAKQVTFNTPTNATIPTGGDGNYTYMWEWSSPGNSDWNVILGETGPGLVFTYPITEAFFRRTVFSGGGCAESVSEKIQVNKPSGGVTQNVLNDGEYCAGGTGISVSLDASVPSATYVLEFDNGSSWIPAPGFSSISGTGGPISFTNITIGGDYRITATFSTCASSYSRFSVTVLPLPTAPSVNSPAAICQGVSTNIVGYTLGDIIKVNWYAAATGGSPLNPTPLDGGANYAVTPAITTTYYAEAVNSTTGCVSSTRTPVTVTVNQRPTVTNTDPAPICSGSLLSIPLTNDINAAATYTWIATGNPNTTGESTTSQSTGTISNTIFNNTNALQTVSYNVTATYPSGCAGNTKTILATIDPMPTVVNQTVTVCSENVFTISPANGGGNIITTTPATLYSWGLPGGVGFTGGADAIGAANISGTLTDTTNAQVTATYTVTPSAGSCTGTPFTATVTINPKPFINAQAVTVCNGTPFTVTPSNGGGNIVPIGTLYNWPNPTGVNISGFAAGNNQTNIFDTITNTTVSPTTAAVTATYIVTPVTGTCTGNDFTLIATINATIDAGGIVGDQTLCNGANPTTINDAPAVSMPPGTISYIWQSSTTGCGRSWTVISGATGGSYTPPAGLSVTTYYRRITVSTINGVSCYSAPTGCVTVTVAPPGITGTWTGYVSTDWFNCANWANGIVPTNVIDVDIPAGSMRDCVIDPTSPYAPVDKIARCANISISRLLGFTGSGDLYVAGHWQNNIGTAGFAEGAGNVTFMGGAVQAIATVDAIETFNNLTANNGSGSQAAITLNKAVNVSGLLSMTNGQVLTTMANLLTVTNTAVAAVSGGGNSSFVNGPIRRYISGSSNGAYFFPIGKVNKYKPATVTTVSALTNNDFFTGEYFNDINITPTIGADFFDAILFGILKDEYWQIDRGNTGGGAGLTEAKVTLPYNYSGPGQFRDPSGSVLEPCSNCNVAVVKRGTSGPNVWSFSTAASTTFASGGTPPEYRAYSDNGDIISKTISTFSPFTIGWSFNTILGTLPIKLLSFDAKLQNADGYLQWSVDSYKDVQLFELQHSVDGLSFTKLDRVLPGATTKYTYKHFNIPVGANYYRLLVKDKKGESSYSKVVQIIRHNLVVTTIEGLKSNPVQQHALVSIHSARAQQVHWRILDLQGRTIHFGKDQLAAGANLLRLSVNTIANGYYSLQVITDDAATGTFKMLKE